MSFGYSSGDFISLLQLSLRVIKSYQDAPKQFRDISEEANGLNTVLKRTKEVIDHDAAKCFGSDLRHLTEGCYEVLQDANIFLEKFRRCSQKSALSPVASAITPLSALTSHAANSDGSIFSKFFRIKNKRKNIRDRFQWDENAVATLRMRIMVNTMLMMAYNTSVQNTTPADIENSVKVAINDLLPMLAGRIEPYIVNLALRMTQSGGSTLTVDSLETVKSEALREITETAGGNSQKEDEDEELVTANSLIAGQSSAAHWHSAQPPIPDLPGIYSSNNLLTAVLSGSLPQVRTILATGVSADSLSPDSLIRAVHGDSEMIRLLLDHGANPNLHSLVDGSTALIAAVSGGLTEVAQLILNGGVDVNATDTELWTALHHAANSGHLPVVRLLLRRSDIQVDAPAKGGDTPLVRAAWQGKDEIVSLLMERGADINFAMDPRKDTPLIRAAAYSEEGVVRLLLRHGADVDRVCEGRWTALLHAADTGNIVIAGLLLDHDADTEIETTVLKDTPLIKAAWHDHKGVVQLLLDHGADVTKKNKRGLTARHFMAGHLLGKAARDLGNLIWMSRISR